MSDASFRFGHVRLLLALILIAAAVGSTAVARDIIVDSFDGPHLDPQWTVGPEREHRDDEAWSLTRHPGHLTIIAQDADIHRDRNEPINYFLRDVEWEDFEITTKLAFAPREQFEHAGLIVWKDMDHYIKLVHVHGEGNRLEGAIEANGQYSTQQILNPVGDEVYLRIRKLGRSYTYLYSGDGENWEQLGSRVESGWADPKVGLLAVAPGSGRSIPARFEYFSIRRLEEPEEPRYVLPPDTTERPEPGPGQVAVGYQNPVYLADIPDPAIVRSGEWFYVMGTQSFLFNRGAAIPVIKSRDLVNWEYVGNAFDNTEWPAWINRGNPSLWAPDLIHREDTGRYYLHFSAMGEVGMGIGVGWAEHPEGPYIFLDEPLVAGPGYRNIDSFTFVDDDGTTYMYWGSHHSAIMAQEMSADGLSLVGEVHDVLLSQNWPVIIDADHGPTGQNENLVEAPWVIKRGDYYYLFYSGNAYYPNAYSVMIARSTSPLGPFDKFGRNPILTTNRHFNAPGHNALIQDDAGQDWIVYHAYLQSHLGFGRALLIDRVDWIDGWPVINDGEDASHDFRPDGPIINLDEPPTRNVAVGKSVTASSEVEGHEARNAVDGNTFTRWTPAGIDEPQWLLIDLEREYDLDRTQIVFRSARGYIRDPQRVEPGMPHVDQYYQYRIEYSSDGSDWRLYADQTNPQVNAYPYIDHQEVTARYLRITVTGYMGHRPNKNIYQVKVFGTPREQEQAAVGARN
jgi:arabinan endo-1,5-alpha-L-arabinosidase